MLQRRLFVFALFAVAFFLSFASRNVIAQTYSDLHDFNCAVEGCRPIGPALLAQGRDGNLYGTTWIGGTNNKGTVFKATPGGAVTTLYSFDGATGANPQGGLTLATDGNFYGTTSVGGAYGYGTIFRITPAGTLTVLHSFNGTDGSQPYAPPMQASNGNLYGRTFAYNPYRITLGGKFTLLPIPPFAPVPNAPYMQAADGYLYGTGSDVFQCGQYGCVIRMSLAGAVKVIHSFDNTHGAGPNSPVAQASDGNLYGMTSAGGDFTCNLGCGTIFKLTTRGVLTVLHNLDSSNDGSSPPGGLVAASDGSLYGAATWGGAGGTGTLFKLTKTGSFTLLHAFDFLHGDGANPQDTPMQHTNGTIYGVAQMGGAYGAGILYSLSGDLPPFVALMSTSGTPGKTVQILGQDFNSATSVKFGSGSASFTKVSDTYMTAVIPAEGTTGYVTVTTGSGALTSNKQFKVKPIITSFTPASGSVGGQVTITGGGFRGATKVTFGGVKATSFAVNSGSQITATVPIGAKTGKIAVTTPGGSASSKGIFAVM